MALVIKYPILQIVGYQNSGKTTLVEKIIKKGCEDGYKIATIKHHGDSCELEPIQHEKDSKRHQNAGAVVSSVEGGGMLQLEAKTINKWTLDDMLKLYTFFEHHMIIIEGYKSANYPKIVLIREEKDVELLSSLANIVAVISWIPIQGNFTVFDIYEEDTYLNWIYTSSEGNK